LSVQSPLVARGKASSICSVHPPPLRLAGKSFPHRIRTPRRRRCSSGSAASQNKSIISHTGANKNKQFDSFPSDSDDHPQATSTGGLCSALCSSPPFGFGPASPAGRRRHRQVPNCPHRSPLYKYGAGGSRHKILPKGSPRNPPPAHFAIAIGLSPSRRRRRILRP